MSKVLLAAIAKDEAAYLPEWIYYHLSIGIDEIVIYVNSTTDNTIQILDKLKENLPVKYVIADGIEKIQNTENDRLIDTNFISRNPLQSKAYADIYKATDAENFSHILYLDIDEYFYSEKNIHDLAENYRSDHEPDVVDLTSNIINYHKGRMSVSDCRDWLLQRDQKLKLDVEASHPLGYVAPILVETFPTAKFVITVRNVRDWLKSRLDFHKIKQPREWEHYRNYIWSKGHSSFSPEEEVLKEHGLYSLDAYLKQYIEQYTILFNSLPRDRTLIVNTDELNQSIEPLSHFLNIDKRTIQRKHMNQVKNKLNILDQLDPEFVNNKVDVYEKHLLSLKSTYLQRINKI